ncbi:hypothetical protein [Desulfosoma sp.]|uniref:hypothetical protein n=2 Tax=Desulfosoma sp. TaxID=2603217 RepID=UPI00404933F7
MKGMRWMVVLGLVVVAAMPVWARGPYGAGMGPCWALSSPEGQAFAKDVAPLQQQLYQKRLQYQQMLNNPNADPAALGTLAQEMQQIRRQIWQKAQDAGIPCGYGPRGQGMGWGMGPGAPQVQ